MTIPDGACSSRIRRVAVTQMSWLCPPRKLRDLGAGVLSAIRSVRLRHCRGCRALRHALATALGSEQSAGNKVAIPGSDLMRGEGRTSDPRGPGAAGELARLNGDMASLALRIMDGSASVTEQQHYAQRLIAVGERLQLRADEMRGVMIEGR